MKNLFTGQPWRNRHETDIENRLIDMERGEERVRCMEPVLYLYCKNDWPRPAK